MPRNPAVIFANGFGDHLLNLPAIRALASIFEGQLSLICLEGLHRCFFSDIPFRRVCEVAMHADERGRSFDAENVAQAVAPCDCLISLNPWYNQSTARLIQLLAPEHTVGFFPEYEFTVPRDYTKHSADLAFDIPLLFDNSLRIEDFASPPTFPESDRAQAKRLLCALPADASLLAVHTETLPEKMWPPERFIETLDAFLAKHSFYALVVDFANRELDRGEQGDRVISCAGLSIGAAASVVAESSLFLGIDSVFLHAADLFRVPSVALFGPTPRVEWGIRFGVGRHVEGDGSMASIRPAQVLEALDDVLQATRG